MNRKRFHMVPLLLLLTACGDTAYHSQLKLLYSHDVPAISADSLFSLMNEQGAGQRASDTSAGFLLLDTREWYEWQLSHLPHAQYAGFENFTLNLSDIPGKETPIVLYCTIGYRSEQIAEQLMEAGYTRVSHLYGGIIEWKNSAYPLLNNSGRAIDSVHTYDRYWGIFLKKGIPIYE